VQSVTGHSGCTVGAQFHRAGRLWLVSYKPLL